VKDAWWHYINEPFIRYTANARKPVYVSTDPKYIVKGNLLNEYNLLLRLGYGEARFDPSTGLWKMIPLKP
jgi:hypothetical protein